MNDHGFELTGERVLPELRCLARAYMHRRTGARLISAEADDRNKTFGISFRTPVTDSTGAPHILEHAVLCGSEKYPVKKPFLELLRGSLYTFLNAFTALDRTTYPVACLNLKSFYNLVDVYLDAVFAPLLLRETFEQEGWRHELADAAGTPEYKGVVFNEMKGAQSSPTTLLMRASRSSLFDDHPYAHDAGGAPDEIPNLTWQRLKDFHAAHYHPSNAILFFYGDDDPAYRLELIDQRLAAYAYRKPPARIPPAPLAQRRRCVQIPYAPMETGQDKGHVTCNWLLPRIKDPLERTLLHVASSCLLGSASAPLYKALIDSGLGEEVTMPHGLSFDLYQPLFSVGLEGVKPDAFPQVETLIDDTLADIAAQGFDQDLIDAVFNSMEFSLREIQNQSFPRGIVLMMSVTADGAYEKRMGWSGAGSLEIFNQARRAVRADKSILTDAVRRYLPRAGHRSRVALHPDPTEADRLRQWEAEELQKYAASLDDAGKQALATRSQWLQDYQNQPDAADALATIPVLSLSDLDKDTKEYPCAEQDFAGCTYLSHELDTSGIVYVKLLFDLHALPQECLPYLDLFTSALRQTGTDAEDFVTFSRRIARQTGGIGVGDTVMPSFKTSAAEAYLGISGKCLPTQIDNLAELTGQILARARLDNRERLQQLLLQAQAHMEAGLVPGGSSFVGLRLTANRSEVDWLDENADGVSALLFLRDLCRDFDARWPEIHARLETMRAALFRTGNLKISVTAAAAEQERLKTALRPVLEALPADAAPRPAWQPDAVPENEALIIPAPVNYVGRTYDLARAGFDYHGAVSVALRLINTSWLWPMVREQGGAYGCSAGYNRFNGQLACVSYRDPAIGNTLGVYDSMADFLRQYDAHRGELDKLIIGTFGDLDQDLQPRAQGAVALNRYLTGSTRDIRQRKRDEILATSEADIRRLAEYMADSKQYTNTVALGSADAIQEAQDECGIEWTHRLAL